MSDTLEASQPAPPPTTLPQELNRTISPIAGRFSAGWTGKVLVLAGLVAGCGVFLAATWVDGRAKPPPRPVEPARQIVPFEPLATTQAPASTPPASDLATAEPEPASAAQDASAPDPNAARRAELSAIRGAPLLAYSRSGRADALGDASSMSTAVELQPASNLQGAFSPQRDAVQGTPIGRAQASRLGDRNYLILAGAAIPCTLQTAMDTATPGFVTCLIPRDVLSDNGAVVLLDRGTRVLGEYRSTLKQGQSRLHVLWTRAVTPAGVAIALASPAADPLGRAGFDGVVDTHFWERFGGALLLSIVDDGAYAIAGRGSQAGMARLPSDAAAMALQNSVNIPPSLRKAQGAEVSIFVAQDLDFSTVYGLAARQP